MLSYWYSWIQSQIGAGEGIRTLDPNLGKEAQPDWTIPKINWNKLPIQIRIRIHSGPAVSGVIGKSKFAFDVWGDTINTAARLESNGEPGKIHLSQTTFGLLDKNSSFNVRSQSFSMKGKGVMQTILIGQAVKQ